MVANRISEVHKPIMTPGSMPSKTSARRVKVPSHPQSDPVIPVPNKQVEPKRISQCQHVLAGAVWCEECAEANLAYARLTHQRATKESGKPVIVKAALEYLKRALEEYSLTSAGQQKLEQEYAFSVARKDDASCKSIRAKIDRVKSEASRRNIDARKAHANRLARENTLNALPKKYLSPPVDESGFIALDGVPVFPTTHARQRMEERNISHEMVEDALIGKPGIHGQGKGIWLVTGQNNICLSGFFEEYKGGHRLVILTAYNKTENIDVSEYGVQV